MKRVFVASILFACVLALPASAQGPANQNRFDLTITVNISAFNACNGDLVTGTGTFHLVAHDVTPNAEGSPGFLCHILDQFHGSATGTPSGLSYKVRMKGGLFGVNGSFHLSPANGPILLQDDVSVTFDPIGAGSQGQKFTSRLLQGVTIPLGGQGSPPGHILFDAGSCNN